jgi:hypothetical protein
MNTLKFITVYILTIFIFYGCQNNNQKNAELIRQLNPTDKFIRDIPFDECYMQRFIRDEKFLGLDSLSNGFDSIKIRIWYGCALEGQERFIILSLTSGTWQAEIIEPTYHYSDNFRYKVGKCWVDRLDSISKKVSYVNPKSGWENIITKLFALHILSLPNFENIQDYKDKQLEFMDGCGVTVQIATKRIHRIYNYGNPDVFVNKYQEAKNIIDIARLLNIEFAIGGKWPTKIKSKQTSPDSIEIKKVQIEEIKPKTK